MAVPELTNLEIGLLTEPISIMQVLGVEGDGIAMRALVEIVEGIMNARESREALA